jgi:hypothetical protein
MAKSKLHKRNQRILKENLKNMRAIRKESEDNKGFRTTRTFSTYANLSSEDHARMTPKRKGSSKVKGSTKDNPKGLHEWTPSKGGTISKPKGIKQRWSKT